MITLYHCRDARSFRALWALEEVGVPYELKLLPFPPRFLQREYLEINPLGTVPLLIDGETRMTESAAICQYLADRYAGPPLAVDKSEPAYGAYLNALHFGEATLTFPQTIVLRYGVARGAGEAAAAGRCGLFALGAGAHARVRDADGGRRICRRRALHGRRHLDRLRPAARAHDRARPRNPGRCSAPISTGSSQRPAFQRAKDAQKGVPESIPSARPA